MDRISHKFDGKTEYVMTTKARHFDIPIIRNFALTTRMMDRPS